MSGRPTHASLAGDRYLGLRALARAGGRPTAELLQLYALEGFLARLSRSPHRDLLVLKGGVLLAAFEARRPSIAAEAIREDDACSGVRVPRLLEPDSILVKG